MSSLLKDFRDFVMRGNVLDLAVAVIVGAAFNTVVNSLVNDVLLQIVAGIFGEPNFNDLSFTLGEGVIRYGAFLTALVNLVIVAATLFVIIRAFEQLQRRRRRGDVEEPEASKTDEVVLLEQIRDLLAQRQS
jgi:large conductance mechanosensitive channel